MISPKMNMAQGQAIDEHFDSRISLKNFNYLECTDCHSFHEVGSVNVSAWKFSLMGLRPSILSVAKGVCPTCQELRNQFKRILEL